MFVIKDNVVISPPIQGAFIVKVDLVNPPLDGGFCFFEPFETNLG